MRQSTIPALAPNTPAGDVEVRVLTVTPELASEWLTRNTRNRVISGITVAQFASDMEEGRWHFTGQPIVFDTNGTLSDGQHRLTAQVKVGVTLQWLVVGGVDVKAQDFIDIGRPRSVANQLQIEGRSFTYNVSAAARLYLIYEGVAHPSKPQIKYVADKHYDQFARLATVGKSISTIIGGPTAAYAVAAFYLEAIDPDLSGEFFAGLSTGADLAGNSPILVARNKIQRNKASGKAWTDPQREAFINFLFRVWNHWVSGKTVATLREPSQRVTPIDPKTLA